MKRGWGIYQSRNVRTSILEILNVLKDGKQHRYKEIREKTGLSTATLSKHLKYLEKQGKIIKEIDFKGGKYPYPVFYSLSPMQVTFEAIKDELKKLIDEAEDIQLLKTVYDFAALTLLENQRKLKKVEEVQI